MPKLAAPVCAKSTGRMTASDPPNVVANAFGLHLATISSLTSVPDHKNNLGCLWWTHMLVRVKSLMKVCMNFLMKMKELDIKITGAKFDNILCRLTLDNGTWNYVKLASCFNCVSSVIQYIKGGKWKYSWSLTNNGLVWLVTWLAVVSYPESCDAELMKGVALLEWYKAHIKGYNDRDLTVENFHQILFNACYTVQCLTWGAEYLSCYTVQCWTWVAECLSMVPWFRHWAKTV